MSLQLLKSRDDEGPLKQYISVIEGGGAVAAFPRGLKCHCYLYSRLVHSCREIFNLRPRCVCVFLCVYLR